MSPPLFPSPVRSTPVPADHNYRGWNFSPLMGQAATILPTAGLLTLVRVKLETTLVTNVIIHITVAGGTLTADQCLAALYSGAGTLLAPTGNQATLWQTGGLQVMPLTTPQAVAFGSYGYVGFYANGTTQPTLTRAINSSSAIVNAGLAAPNFAHCTADAGLTTAMPATLGAQTGTATAYWAAVS